MTRPTAMAPDASTSPVEWGPEIEVSRRRPFRLNDGEPLKLLLPQALGGDRETTVQEQIWWPHITAICLRADHPFYAKTPTTPERDPALWDRMVALVRDIAEQPIECGPAVMRAREIRAELAPVDPDVELAIKLAEGKIALEEYAEQHPKANHWAVQLALEGIRRGRQLATPEVSHVG